MMIKWRCGVMVITTAQLHSSKPELRFWAGSNPARGVSKICDGEDLWQWYCLEIRLNAFRRSTILQKQFIIIIINISQMTQLTRDHKWKYDKSRYLSNNGSIKNNFWTILKESYWGLQHCRKKGELK